MPVIEHYAPHYPLGLTSDVSDQKDNLSSSLAEAESAQWSARVRNSSRSRDDRDIDPISGSRALGLSALARGLGLQGSEATSMAMHASVRVRSPDAHHWHSVRLRRRRRNADPSHRPTAADQHINRKTTPTPTPTLVTELKKLVKPMPMLGIKKVVNRSLRDRTTSFIFSPHVRVQHPRSRPILTPHTLLFLLFLPAHRYPSYITSNSPSLSMRKLA